ncbi:MAG: hypothetical protein RL328_1014 [Acidobacteriota bacterium]
MKYIAGLVILALLGIGAWQVYEWRRQPPEVAFATATRETIASLVSTNGKVEPSESAEARAEAAGRVEKIHIALRQQVKVGDPLVELDTAQLRHDLEAAEARIAAVKADLDVLDAGGRPTERVALQTQIDSLNVELRSAREEYDREVRLESKQASTREQVSSRKARIDSIEAQIAGLQKRIASLIVPTDRKPLELRLRQEESARNQIQERIKQSTVRAPITGVVYQFDLKPGAYLNPGDVVATIGRLNDVRVKVYVDEPDLGRVHRGQPVTITWDAMPNRTWEGTVDRLPTQIIPLETRQVGEVLCLIKNPNLDLLPGTNITARIESQVVPNAITIPKEAVFRENAQVGVYILNGDKLEWRTVTQGVNNVTRTEVKELKEGDKIAIPGDRPFTTGMQVRIAAPQ